MTRVVFVTRTYPPFPSPSGGIVRLVADEMRRHHEVVVVAWTGQDGMDPAPAHIGGVRWLTDDARRRARFGSRVRRWLGLRPSRRRRRLVACALTELGLGSSDIVIACTPDEISALHPFDADVAPRMRLLMFEPLLRPSPRARRLPVLGELLSRGVARREHACLRAAERTFALPSVANRWHGLGAEASRLTVVEHPMLRDLTEVSAGSAQEPPKVVYAGSLDRTTRNPTPVLELLARARAHTEFVVDFYSMGNCQHLLEGRTDLPFLTSHGSVSPQRAEALMAGADIILTIGNTDPILVPSKVFDCMSTGRPIVHVAQTRNDPYYEYLERYPYALVLNVADPVEDSAQCLATFVREHVGARCSWTVISAAFPEALPARLVDELVSV